MEVGNYVVFKDNPAFSGVIFEFQDEGMVAGLKNISQKLKDSGAPDETHEPVENLALGVGAGGLKIGDVVTFKSDGPTFFGTVFEFQDEGMVAGLKELSDKLKGTGCGDETQCAARDRTRLLSCNCDADATDVRCATVSRWRTWR